MWEQNGRSEVLLELSYSEIIKKVTQLLFTKTSPKAVGIIITPHITVPYTNFVWETAPSSGPGPRFLPSCGSKFPMCLHYYNQCQEKEYEKSWVFRPAHLQHQTVAGRHFIGECPRKERTGLIMGFMSAISSHQMCEAHRTSKTEQVWWCKLITSQAKLNQM